MHIDQFRLFHDKTISLGKYITAISGHNATGKSTLLAILAQCGELKGAKYKPILYPSFRADLAQILKFSEDKDIKIPKLGRLIFEDTPVGNPEYPSELSFRATRQKSSDGESIRYRIIPRKTETRGKESKLKWPTLYIGLGRLFPIGESEGVTKFKTKLEEEEQSFIIDNSKHILSLNEEIEDFTAMSIQETAKKKAFGVNTTTYDYLCNSAGQDNLGQILLALLSFKRLKATLGEDWNGGLLLIDEIDATLHPAAQVRLLKVLFRTAKEIGIQIVFTTHSLSLLEKLAEITIHNKQTEINCYELVYITNGNEYLEIKQNPPFKTIYQDLNIRGTTPTVRKVPLFSEDEETRFFLKYLVGESNYRKLRILNASFGCEQLLSLIKSDYYNFSHYIFLLDGDVENNTIRKYINDGKKQDFLLRLPMEGKRPETLLWEYFNSMGGTHEFVTGYLREQGANIRNVKEYGPLSEHYQGKDRIKFKKWFNDNIDMMNALTECWISEHPTEVEKFNHDFKTAYNYVATQLFIPNL